MLGFFKITFCPRYKVLNFSTSDTKFLVLNVGRDSVPPNPIARANVVAIEFLKGFGAKFWRGPYPVKTYSEDIVYAIGFQMAPKFWCQILPGFYPSKPYKVSNFFSTLQREQLSSLQSGQFFSNCTRYSEELMMFSLFHLVMARTLCLHYKCSRYNYHFLQWQQFFKQFLLNKNVYKTNVLFRSGKRP